MYNPIVNNKRILYITLAIALVTILARVIPGPRTVDDAYITFRYAQNIIDGNGMVYNPGERVLGTTTPVFALLMTLFGSTFGGANAPFPWIALLLSTIADVATIVLIIRIGENFGYPKAGIATSLIWSIAPMSVTFAIGGMETSLFVCLMTATFYFYSTATLVPAALFAGMSLLTRPDALLFLLPLGIDRIRRRLIPMREDKRIDRISIAEIAAFVVPVGIWIVFGFVYFGSPLPNSIAAKTAAYLLPPNAALIRLLQHYSTPFLGHLTFGQVWIIIGFILFPVLYGLGILKVIRERLDAWAIFAFPILYLLAYSIANPLIFRWYLTPPLPIYFFGIFLGIERISIDFRKPVIPFIFAALAFGLTLNGWTLRLDHGPTRPAPEMAFIKLELMYEQVGRDLENEIKPNEVLAAGDIGALGYFTGARILDTVGLITPQVASYYPLPESYYEINYAIAPGLILDNQPEFLVILEIYGRDELLEEPEFNENYFLRDVIETDIYGSNGMLVYERVGSN